MKENEILVDNLKINYKIAGSGPAILILHGWGGGSNSWLKFQEIISNNGYKVIILDLPGFGKSEKPFFAWELNDYCSFIEKFIFSLNLEKFYLLGHSFGGALAIKYCFKFPQKIEKLFLIGAACFRRNSLRKKLFLGFVKIFKIFSILPFYSKIRKIFYKYIIKSDYLFSEERGEVMKNTYLKIIKEDLSNILEKIKISTIIIWGEKDKLKRVQEAYFINEKIKNSELKIISNAGHNLHSEIPEKFSQIVLNFLKN